MPYRDKEAEKKRKKAYFQANKALFNLKQKRRRKEAVGQSQGPNGSVPEAF